MAPTLTRAFVACLRAAHARILDEPGAVAMLDALVMDGLAVTLAGVTEAGPTILRANAGTQGLAGERDATVLGSDLRLSPTAAARCNGAAMHVLDYEPMWNPANHAISTVLPAILALLESAPPDQMADEARNGRALLAALAVGIETQARLRRASGQFEPGHLVFHPPGVVGPLGSAMACGLLLGLDDTRLCHALGIAASRAGGVLANVGSMTKALHCGGAAADGLEAALLAQRGFTADSDALDGPRGYCAAFFGADADREALLAVGAPAALEPGPAFKFFPSQYGTHFVIDAALAVHACLGPDAVIDRVRIVCPPMPYVDRQSPSTGLAGKFSFQYVAAAALMDGKVDLSTFTDARRFAPDMESLLQRIDLAPDPAREGRFDRMRVDVIAHLHDGTDLQHSCDGPPGIWGRPAAPERLVEKARGCLEHAGFSERSNAVLARMRNVSALDGVQLGALIRDLATTG